MSTQTLSTTVFQDRPIVPEFIRTHPLFRKPVSLKKIFNSVGLPNFTVEAHIDKCLVDVRKEGSYVYNLLKEIHKLVLNAKTSLEGKADAIQYLGLGALKAEDREAARKKIKDVYRWKQLTGELANLCDPHNKEVLANAIQSSEGKINIRITKTVFDDDGKKVFHDGRPLFRIYAELQRKMAELDVRMIELEQTEAFQIFCRENIPNRKYQVVFSADGRDGAWDILTMSMRGIKSCQRWDGEHPRCLIGSILSEFVGVIYLTSGVKADTKPCAGTSVVIDGDIGSKMMRRSVVRYVVDADDNKPHILIDKMYPELDNDILSVFVAELKKRTELDVHYAPDLISSNKLRNLFIPYESIRKELLDREWSYQDTVLKSKEDLDVAFLISQKEELEKEVKAFNINLNLHIANQLQTVYEGSLTVEPEIKKIVRSARLNTSFIGLAETLTSYIVRSFRAPHSHDVLDSKAYYKKYLRDFLTAKTNLIQSTRTYIHGIFAQYSSTNPNIDQVARFVMSLIAEFVELELKKLDHINIDSSAA